MKKKVLIGAIILAIILIGTLMLFIFLPNSKDEPKGSSTPQQTQPTEKHEHIWGEWITEKESTCTEKGVKSRSCQCGAKDEILYAELDHTFSEWTVTKEAQCEVTGEEERECSLCGFIDTKAIAPLTHAEGDWIIRNDKKQYLCVHCKTLLRSEELTYSVGLNIENETVTSRGSCLDTDIVIPPTFNNFSIKTIDRYAFEYENITSIILPDTIEVIEEKAFYQCAKLEILHLGNGVTTIEKRAFSRCFALKSVSLPNSLTTLEDNAFEYCSNLETVYMENSLVKFEMRIFQYCTKLTDIYFNGTIEEWNAIEKDREWDLGIDNYTIHCTNGNIEK